MIAAYWRMARPSQVLAVLLVFGLGVIAASRTAETFDPVSVLWGLAIVLPVTVSIHYANEYADLETDALTVRTPYSGGSGVLPSGVIPRQAALWASVGLMAVGLLISVGAVILGPHNWLALGIMILIAVGGWAYSVPPLALSWRGFGEIDNAMLGGMLMPLYGYCIITGGVDLTFMLACVPFTIMVFVNLLATTWPDRIADAAVGKLTLVTRLRPSRSRRLFIGLAVLAFGLLPVLLLAGVPWTVAAGGAAAIPLAAWAAVVYTRQEDPTPAVWAMVVMMLGTIAGWWAAPLI